MSTKRGLDKLESWQYIVFLVLITMLALAIPFGIVVLVFSAGGTPIPG